jgi:hypothetical protein
MIATTRFRYVERPINICTSPDGTVSHGTMVRILQQWWDNDIPGWKASGEWRDVPLEVEA